MNIAICDDLQLHMELLEKYIEEYAANHNQIVEFSYFSSGEALLENFEKDKYGILFLDIYMSGKSGIETAKAMRETGSQCLIIFTTTSLDHAIESFDLQAIHYLVKPLSYNKVENALDRCMQRLTLKDKYIEIMSERVMVRVLLKELMFAEVYSNVMVLHTTSGDVKTYMTLDDLAVLLEGNEFLRCHRSYIVNMDFIIGMENCDFLLKNNQKVPIPRQDKVLMKQYYANYLFHCTRGRIK